MHTKLLVVLAVSCLVSSHDVSFGNDNGGRKIFDEIRQANPAIWRQIENVTVIAPDNEVISKVVVTDMRPEKDGDVKIVDGSEGKNSVTIELKSPTVLRGYEFHIEVYTVPETKLTDSEEALSEPAVSEENSESTTHKIEGSGEEIQENVDKTTETPESSTVQIPALVGKTIIDGDILRQSRQLKDGTETHELSPLDIGSSEVSSEPNVSTTEILEKDSNEVTTETEVSTKIDDQQITFAPETFDNNKNTPDYPALSILDLIKSKEGTRRNRHTDEKISNSENEASTTESMNVEGTLYSAEKTSAHSDDTFDLLPPVETEYNTGFSDSEDTEKSTESNTDTKTRNGRGLDLPVQATFDATEPTLEVTTLINENSESSTVTETTIDEQSRNTRDARKDIDETNLNDLEPKETSQSTPLCPAEQNLDKTPSNVIILNGEQLTLNPDTKFQFGIPIVLIIASESNIPSIKIIAEDSSENENKNIGLQVPQGYINAEANFKDDYSEDRDASIDEEFVPKPVMNLN